MPVSKSDFDSHLQQTEDELFFQNMSIMNTKLKISTITATVNTPIINNINDIIIKLGQQDNVQKYFGKATVDKYISMPYIVKESNTKLSVKIYSNNIHIVGAKSIQDIYNIYYMVRDMIKEYVDDWSEVLDSKYVKIHMMNTNIKLEIGLNRYRVADSLRKKGYQVVFDPNLCPSIKMYYYNTNGKCICNEYGIHRNKSKECNKITIGIYLNATIMASISSTDIDILDKFNNEIYIDILEAVNPYI